MIPFMEYCSVDRRYPTLLDDYCLKLKRYTELKSVHRIMVIFLKLEFAAHHHMDKLELLIGSIARLLKRQINDSF